MMLKTGNVTVMVKNMEKAIRFYTKALGMKLKYREGNSWAEVATKELTIGLHPIEHHTHGMRPGKSKILSIGFTVDRLEKAMSALKRKGVSFSSRIQEDMAVRLAFFSDPDGTPLYLCEVKPHSHA